MNGAFAKSPEIRIIDDNHFVVTYKNGISISFHSWVYVLLGIAALSLLIGNFVFKDRTSFTDISEDDYSYEALQWAKHENIAVGIGDGAFSPDRETGRGEAVTMLWKAKGSPEARLGYIPFEDVHPEDFYATPVTWAYEKGISSGLDGICFSPDSRVKRGDIIYMIWIAKGCPKVKHVTLPFTDVSDSDYYYDAVVWAYKKGVTAGLRADEFGAQQFATRRDVVLFLYRVFGK